MVLRRRLLELRVLLLTSLIGRLAEECWTKLFVAQILAVLFLCVFLWHRPYKKASHNMMQALAMLAPILSLGWAFAGGWQEAEGHAEEEDSAYDGWCVSSSSPEFFLLLCDR